jgi:hypothetical protein
LEWHEQVEIAFTKKLRADEIQGMLAAIQFGIFCLLTCCVKTLPIKVYKTIILLLFLYGCETLSQEQAEGV